MIKNRLLTLSFLLFTLPSFARIAPSFNGDLMNGGKLSLQSSLKTDRALLLLFWATWCSPCIEELKSVTVKLQTDPTLPLDIVAVNVDTGETSSNVKPTVKQYNWTFPIILDPKHQIFGKYFQTKSLPFSVLIDGTGEIRATFNGYQEEMFSKVKEVIAKK